eukprot:CAMPEP_0175059560 /NCGR_PEP_ID=MMETSP0052_2-20121109/12500_1 /TAXON_ID=51329 ORGANISM="Polytomella parva, Strain SAG 63-3" /NCGR_SAMPLE_ID=MMETSP0052_2 /ASSEMBLY_ACC=CAM_ASM_000194 /LENGTH=42 /DNA_ID= /DNA_START= /DNA_END= /DNA_ORIENTATION=
MSERQHFEVCDEHGLIQSQEKGAINALVHEPNAVLTHVQPYV